VKRLLGTSVLVACAAAGLLAAFALADDTPPGGTTVTTTTVTTTTATVLAEGVAVGGVQVGGLTPGAAIAALRAYFATPLPVRLGERVLRLDPSVLAAPNVGVAVQRAEEAQPNARVKLVVVVRDLRLRREVLTLAKRYDRKAVDARLVLRHLRPFLVADKPGRMLLRGLAERFIRTALLKNTRDVVSLPTKATKPQVTRATAGHAIVIRRGSNRLYLYKGARFVRRFPVATGQTVYPTPLGRFEIVVKWRNPWWYPPNDPWAAGEKPTPPGPGNPLGTRWMGLSAPGVGIHGTNNESSIGYSVSHGCIRMHVADSEWLFEHVEIGDPVFIVPQ
jgi:L,D-transpeptidase catalytic domain